jgi:SAM-dependent methyltransferase
MKFTLGHLLYEYLLHVQFDIHKAYMHSKLKKHRAEITGRWLDVGAGDTPYKAYFDNTTALDTTNTKRHYKPHEINHIQQFTTFWIDDASQLPEQISDYDGVACFQVLSVIENPEDFFAEAFRVLKPGGYILLSTDFLYPVWSREDYHRLTATALEKLARDSGFVNASTESFGGFGSTLYSLIMRYMRSYPDIWKTNRSAGKYLSLLFYTATLLLLPFISAAGYMVFLFEKNCTQNQSFTFNIMLKAQKAVSKSESL